MSPQPPSARRVPLKWFLTAITVAAAAALAYATCANGDDRDGDGHIELFRAEIVAEYPHQTDAFTQGLLWYEGKLFESTGGFSDSTLREVDLESGEVIRRRELDGEIFAEGLARVDDRLFQITWKNRKVFVWDVSDFSEPIAEYSYPGEGWGLCYDGEHLVMSDGGSELTFRSPDDFQIVDVVTVTRRGRALRQLNELECVQGAVYANIWREERIVRIDPATGHVTGEIDARGLLEELPGVMNGIAWIPEREHFVVTGKLWPTMFEINLVPFEPASPENAAVPPG